jgi:GT2 family glycosyltransferase
MNMHSDTMVDPLKNIRSSLIIVSHNNREDLAKGLPGILNSLSQNDEIILVDNASDDGSPEFVRQRFPEVHLIKSNINIGFGGANNLGARDARGEYLAFLNPDTQVDPGWLDSLIKKLQSDPQLGMVTSKILLMDDPQKINACGNDIHLSGLTLCRGMGKNVDEYLEPEEVAAISGAAFAMRRKLFVKLRGFDREFFLYMEDTDLSLRVRLTGLRILYVPESIVWHAYRLRFGPKKVYYQERNRSLMLLKVLRWRTLLVMLPVFFWVEIITWGFVVLRDKGRIGNIFHAYGWILSHWKDTLALRKSIRLTRRVSDRLLLSTVSSQIDFGQVQTVWGMRFVFSFLNIISVLLTKLTMALIRW